MGFTPLGPGSPAFKSSGPSQLLVEGGHLASLRFLGASLAWTRLRAPELDPADVLSGSRQTSVDPCFGYQPCFDCVETAVLASGPWASHVGFLSFVVLKSST